MRKNLFIFLVFVAVIISFGYFTIFSGPTGERDVPVITELTDGQSVKSDDSTNKGPITGKSTLEYIRLLGRDLECSIKLTSSDNSVVEGTYFVSEGNVRGDFLTESPDLTGQILSSIIMDGESMYVWSDIDGQKYGVKTNLADIVNNNDADRSPVAMDDEVNYDCKDWSSVDGTVFVPPTDILFKDMSELIKSGMEYGTLYEEGQLDRAN